MGEDLALTRTELGQLTDVAPIVERELRIEAAGRTAEALGLRLVEVARPKGRGRRATT